MLIPKTDLSAGERLGLWLATCGIVGRAPVAPGTFGALLALPLCYLLAQMTLSAAIAVFVVAMLVAVWAADLAERRLQRKDPGCVVIDEVIGMMVAIIGLPFTPMVALSGFVLFRLFDIWKPFPIRWIDRRVAGGIGVVLDDVIAGAIANLVLRLAMVVA